MADNINLNISSSKDDIAEYMSVIRLTTSAVASKIGFDVEEIDDIKVSIGEACSNIIKHGLSERSDSFNICYTIYDEKITISVKDNGDGFDLSKIKEPKLESNIEALDDSGLGIFIIKSLMDEVEIKSSPETGTEIIMSKIKIV